MMERGNVVSLCSLSTIQKHLIFASSIRMHKNPPPVTPIPLPIQPLIQPFHNPQLREPHSPLLSPPGRLLPKPFLPSPNIKLRLMYQSLLLTRLLSFLLDRLQSQKHTPGAARARRATPNSNDELAVVHPCNILGTAASSGMDSSCELQQREDGDR